MDTVYFAYTAKLMSDMAAAIGKQQEAEEYRQLFENIKAAFNEKYVKPDGSLTVDNETAYALALYMDLLPAELRAKSGKILADKLRFRRDRGQFRHDHGLPRHAPAAAGADERR